MNFVWNVPDAATITQPPSEQSRIPAERVHARVGRDRISVAGTITRAQCRDWRLGRELLRPSWYHVGIQPEIQRVVRREAVGAEKATVKLVNGAATINIEVPVRIDRAERMLDRVAFSYRVQLLLNGVPYGNTFEAPRQEVGLTGGAGRLGEHQGFLVLGSCNPRVVNGKTQVTVELKQGT